MDCLELLINCMYTSVETVTSISRAGFIICLPLGFSESANIEIRANK